MAHNVDKSEDTAEVARYKYEVAKSEMRQYMLLIKTLKTNMADTVTKTARSTSSHTPVSSVKFSNI